MSKITCCLAVTIALVLHIIAEKGLVYVMLTSWNKYIFHFHSVVDMIYILFYAAQTHVDSYYLLDKAIHNT